MEHNSSQQNRHRPTPQQNRKINADGDIMGTFAQIGAICSSGTRGTTCIAVCPQHASVPSATVAIRPNRTAKNAYSDYSGPSNYAQFNPHFDYQRVIHSRIGWTISRRLRSWSIMAALASGKDNCTSCSRSTQQNGWFKAHTLGFGSQAIKLSCKSPCS